MSGKPPVTQPRCLCGSSHVTFNEELGQYLCPSDGCLKFAQTRRQNLRNAETGNSPDTFDVLNTLTAIELATGIEIEPSGPSTDVTMDTSNGGGFDGFDGGSSGGGGSTSDW